MLIVHASNNRIHSVVDILVVEVVLLVYKKKRHSAVPIGYLYAS
jgi:hypothetical protein